jgi:hypothetical protein
MIVNRDDLFKVVSRIRKHLVQGQEDAWCQMLQLSFGTNVLVLRAATAGVTWREEIVASHLNKPAPAPVHVSCKALYRTLKTSFGSAVGLRLTGGKAGLKVELEYNAKYDKPVTLPTAPLTFPARMTDMAQIEAKALHRLLATVVHAVSPDPTRPHLAAFELTCESKVLRATTTDGHRLATTTIPEVDLPDFAMLLPADGVQAALAALRSRVDTVELAIGKDAATIGCEAFAVSMLRGDAHFVPWQQIVPREGEGATAIFPASVLKGALRDVRGDLAVMEWNQTSVALRFEETTPPGKANKPIGEALRLEASTIMGVVDERPRAYNLRYLQEAIAAMPDGEIEVQFDGDLDPIVLRHRETDTVCVIMPTRM